MIRIRRRTSPTQGPKAHQALGQEQYAFLGRLAWSLRKAGVAASVSLVLPRRDEPYVFVGRISATDGMRIRVTAREGRWIFTWGRGRDQWADISETGFRRLWEDAQ